METVDDAPRPSAGPKPVPAAVVVQSRGRPACRVLRLDGALELGRDTPALADDERLSRRHLRVERRQGRFTVRDLGSRNGTWVDGQRIDDVVTVGDGAFVRGGRTVLLLLDDARALEARGVEVDGTSVSGPALAQALEAVGRAALRGTTLLLRGESGTGKERAARAFHALGPAAPGPFVPVNCATLPEGVAERLLFGAKKGAYSGAVEGDGLVESAHKGVLFLDEVGELDPEVQAKLLRVLETRTVIPVGGREPIAVDVRVVAATHQSLRKAVAEGRFRADLMYRLRVVPIFLPPLRQRPADISLLAQKLVEELNEAGGRQVSRIAPAALTALERYAWPGNVRELRNALEYAYVIGEGSVLDLRDLPAEIATPEAEVEVPLPPLSAPPPEEQAESPEVTRIKRALERAAGHRGRAAQILGMSRVTLWRRMRELKLAP
jgi:transcriptional regulator with PAS, ATPase and Fis domain